MYAVLARKRKRERERERERESAMKALYWS